ncbi:MAG: Gfo/Idh/MocA family oxidoreductase [Deltaproteobacteria bacterium]|nr:Gfo/Idh/MocA family oxidoreductase [Deltaproteobacteria bacterium]
MQSSSSNIVGFGILGAARIAPKAIVDPCAEQAGARVVTVAAREPERARAFAEAQGIADVSESYEALLSRDDVDVVYNPLPNGLHGPWTLEALRAGKHVLCEKPLAANAAEAERLFDEAERRGLLLMEAIHYPYHPVAQHLVEVCRGTGAVFTAPIPEEDIRFDLSLAGGVTMDLGCYTLHVLRMASGQEPEGITAEAKQGPAGIDAHMQAELRFPSGAVGRMRAGMGRGTPFESVFRARGPRGRLEVTRFQAPMIGHEITLTLEGREPERQELTRRTTFAYQLEAFLQLLEKGAPYAPVYGGRADTLGNMKTIDRVYQAAGLPLRVTTGP